MPKSLIWKNFISQIRIKKTLASAFETGSLGHAYLFCGAPGVGKFQAALELALALLCENEENVPCYACKSCQQVLTTSHPDFHCIFPVSLDPTHKKSGDTTKLSEEGWHFIAQETRKKLAKPYEIDESRIKNIPVEWIRELNRSIIRGSVTGKMNVSIIGDIDMMQPASANAMLKTLEEPPPNTIIFLLTHRHHSVLLTLRSRCQIIRFGSISSSDIAHFLSKEYKLAPDNPQVIYTSVCSTGSYGKALSLFDESFDRYAEHAKKMWDLCCSKSSITTITFFLEHLLQEELNDGRDYSSAEKILLSFHHILRPTFFHTINGAEKYIYLKKSTSVDIQNLNVHEVEEIFSVCEKAISAIRARGNILLVLYTFLLSVLEMIHGKK